MVNPSPNVPTAKAPIATPLRHTAICCQRPIASRSCCCQLLAAALLAQRAAGLEAEVEVVEDLRAVGHVTSV